MFGSSFSSHLNLYHNRVHSLLFNPIIVTMTNSRLLRAPHMVAAMGFFLTPSNLKTVDLPGSGKNTW